MSKATNNDNGAGSVSATNITNSVIITGNVVDEPVVEEKITGGSFAELQRVLHDSLMAADAAAHAKLVSNREGIPYPSQLRDPEMLYRTVAEIAVMLAERVNDLGIR